MKLGMNMLLWTTNVTEEHYPLLGALREIGYDGIEAPLARGDAAQYHALGAELDRIGLERTACTSLMPESNPVSPDPAVRRAAVERMKWVVEMAHAMGAEVIGGPFHSAYKTFTGRGATDDERRWSAEVLRAAAEEARSAGIRLAIEALNRFECYLVNTMTDARALVRAVDHPNLGVHYDTHHMHIEEPDVAAAIAHAGAEITHVHASENDRGVPGSGQIAWRPTFDALKRAGYDGWITIESFSRADPDFAGAIHVWRDTFDDPMDVPTKGLPFLRSTWDAARG